MPGFKDGLVALTRITEHACRLLIKYRPKMDNAISIAVTTGAITSFQAGVLNTWLDGAQTACGILKIITGY
jgi:hypothetical protein